MEKKINKSRLIMYISLGMLLSIIIVIPTTLFLADSDYHKTIVYDYVLVKHLQDNNLSILDEQNINGEWVSSKDIYNYNKYIRDNFNYSKNMYDCKYYTLMYVLYAKKHDIDYEYILTTNHISVILDFGDKYCLADQQNLECIYTN